MTYSEAVMIETDINMLIDAIEELADNGEAEGKTKRAVVFDMDGKKVKQLAPAYGLQLKLRKIIENSALTDE